MNLIPIICPQCGAKVKIMQGENTAKCSHCATELFIDKNEVVNILKEDIEGKWEKTLALTLRYMSLNDFDNVYTYSAQLIEIKPNDPKGWFYKSIACGNLSAKFRSQLAEFRSQYLSRSAADPAMRLKNTELTEKANAYFNDWVASAKEAIRLARENPNDPFSIDMEAYCKNLNRALASQGIVVG